MIRTLSHAQELELHKKLLLIRRVEECLAALYQEQEMRTPTHFGLGQEAIAAGVCFALGEDDAVCSHHRCHNHYLAKGGDLTGLVAELYGRERGCSRGKGGSVHLTDRERGFLASSAILGQMIAVAVGIALSFKMDAKDNVAVTFFGEASCEEGIFYESLNYASIRALPVLFVCENNLYSSESSLSVRQPEGTELCERVSAFKVRAEKVDGNRVERVHDAARRAVDDCRAGRGPVFIECMTYRWLEHVGPYYDHDQGRDFRSRAELEEWMDRCPVKQNVARLLESGIATDEQINACENEIEALIDSAVSEARKAPWPKVETLFDDVV